MVEIIAMICSTLICLGYFTLFGFVMYMLIFKK